MYYIEYTYKLYDFTLLITVGYTLLTDIICYYRLLGSIEVLSEALPAEVGGEPVVITQTSFAISVQEVEVETFQGQTISANGVNLDFNNSETVTTKPAVSLELPRNLFQVSTGNSTRITNSVFLNDLLYLRRDTKNLNVSGIIISAGLAGIDRVYNLTNPTVNLEFQRNIVSDSNNE